MTLADTPKQRMRLAPTLRLDIAYSAEGWIERFGDSRKRTVVTIGNFDGVHLGHQKILSGVTERARPLAAQLAYDDRMRRAQSERIAQNTPIQGTAADLLKLAMVHLAAPVVPALFTVVVAFVTVGLVGFGLTGFGFALATLVRAEVRRR